MPNLVASGLFGDGAAAVVAAGGRAAPRRPGPRRGARHPQPALPRLRAHHGLRRHRRRPADRARRRGARAWSSRYLRDDVDGFLADHGLTRADIGWWVCHPGGPKVIEALEDALEVPREAVQLTWDSLARIGNLSSASVLHVLEDTLRDRPPPPGSLRRAAGDGSRLLLRAGAAAAGAARTARVTSLLAFTVLVAAGRPRAARRARRLHAQRRLEPASAAASRPAAATTRSWWCCTPACWSARWSRRGSAAPTSPPRSPGRCSSLVLAVAGAALVVHRHPRPPLEHPGDRRARAGPGTAGPYRWLRHPNYVAVVVEGVRAAAGARRLDHRAGVHGGQRRPAGRADPGRGRRPRAAAPATAPSMRDLARRRRRAGRPRRPRCTPPGPASTSPCVEPRGGADRQGLRRGADAGRGRRPRRPRRRPEGHPIAGIRYVDGGTRVPRRRSGTAPAAACAARRCTRPCADAVRGGRACRSERRAVRAVEDRGDHLLVDGEPARYLVAADGLHSPVRRLLGLDAPAAAPAPVRPALPRRRWRRGPSFVEVHWSPAGRGLRDPGGDDLVGVAVLQRPPAPVRRAAAALPGARDRVGGRAGSRGCAAPARCGSAPGAAWPAGCCWSATRPATSTRSPARASRCGSPRPRAAVAAVAAGRPGATSGPGDGSAGATTCSPGAARGRPGAPGPARAASCRPRRALPRVFGAAVDQLARPA